MYCNTLDSATSVYCNTLSNQLSHTERVRVPCVFRKQSGVLFRISAFLVLFWHFDVHTKFAEVCAIKVKQMCCDFSKFRFVRNLKEIFFGVVNENFDKFFRSFHWKVYGIIEMVNEFFYNFTPIQKSTTSDYNKNFYFHYIWIFRYF